MADTLTSQEQIYTQSSRYLRALRAVGCVFEFTRDPAYLHQYYLLRARLSNGIASFSQIFAQADEVDKRSHILIARRGNQVIAGVRLTISSPRQPQPLPMESHGVEMASLVQHFEMDEKKIAEVSAWGIETEFLTEEMHASLFYHLNRKMAALGVVRYFGLTNQNSVQQYRQMMRQIDSDLFLCNFLQAKKLDAQLFTSTPVRIHAFDSSALNQKSAARELESQA